MAKARQDPTKQRLFVGKEQRLRLFLSNDSVVSMYSFWLICLVGLRVFEPPSLDYR